jgi:hypothetical protein
MVTERGKKPTPVSLCPPQVIYGIKPGAEEPATNHMSYCVAIHLMMVQDLEHGEEKVNCFS